MLNYQHQVFIICSMRMTYISVTCFICEYMNGICTYWCKCPWSRGTQRLTSGFLLHCYLPYILMQGLLLHLEFIMLVRIADQWAPKILLSSPQCWGYRYICHIWILSKYWGSVGSLDLQSTNFYPLRYLPSSTSLPLISQTYIHILYKG